MVQLRIKLTDILFGLALLTLVFLRVYKINSSLLFYNDMGRDFVEINEGWEHKKPPLLGPQTSAVSFNQSAAYYYLIFPFFLLTGKSGFASFETALLVYALIFCWLFWRYRKSSWVWSVITLTWLVAVQPELIRQNRFIWNPSFLVPFLSISLFSYLELLKKFNKFDLALTTFFSALAVSFSYSAAPLVLSMALLSIFLWQKRSLYLWAGWIVSVLLINLPTAVFELVHGFALSRLFLHGQTNPQHRINLLQKIADLFARIFADQNLIIICLFILLIMACFFWSKDWFLQHKNQNSYHQLRILGWLAFLSSLITLALPIQIEPHYIFGTMTILFMTISFMSRKSTWVTVGMLTLWFLWPVKVTANWTPAVRTVTELDKCYEKFCQAHQQPMYVSMQSGIIAYHNAPEHRFFMSKHGCKVEHIEISQNKSKLMAVVADNDIYEHGKTAYNELTLFGPSEEIEVFECQPNLRIHLLTKK